MICGHETNRFLVTWLVGLLSLISAADAQREASPTFLDPKTAGPDFADQGEYVGELAGGKGKLAAQVIALGDDQFQAVFMNGGLPGDGWDGKSRTEIKGKRDGKSVAFTGAYSATITGGSLAGKTDQGDAFTLKRIERVSPDEGEKPAAGAVVLFDGANIDAWDKTAKVDERHLLESGTRTKKKYQDFMLHVEFLLPFKPKARDQERGNSGIYIQDRYEIQILDTFGHPPEFNGCAATYRQTAPKLNMCYPPLRVADLRHPIHRRQIRCGRQENQNAVVTVKQNGVIVQDHTELTNKNRRRQTRRRRARLDSTARPQQSGLLPQYLGGREEVGRELAVPLAQLKPLRSASAATRQAVDDWQLLGGARV